MDISKTPKELDRLILNQQNLLETIPEMVLVVKGSDSFEYMNPSAKLFFGDLSINSDSDDYSLSGNATTLLKIVEKAIQGDTIGDTLETTFNQSHLEYTLAPFTGYKGDPLHWFFIRDMTETKAQFEELSLFHNSIETILSHKIN